MSAQDGGAAFSGTAGGAGYGDETPISAPNGETMWVKHNQGMTLRDYFAAKALPECVREMWGEHDSPECIGVAAYQISDAMLKAREAQPCAK